MSGAETKRTQMLMAVKSGIREGQWVRVAKDGGGTGPSEDRNSGESWVRLGSLRFW